MIWRGRFTHLSNWPGWRKHAPAGLSVLVHLPVVGVLGSLTASVASPGPTPREVVLSVELVTPLPEPAPWAGVTPPARVTTPSTTRETSRTLSAPSAETPAPSASADDADSVYLPPQVLTNPGLSKGLAGLTGGAPCTARYGPKAKECAGRQLAAKTGKMDSVMPRSKQELGQHFGEFMPTCPYLVGCEPSGEYISPAGTRAPPPQSAASAGAEQLGGIHDSVGRLDFNPDHFDRGFGD